MIPNFRLFLILILGFALSIFSSCEEDVDSSLLEPYLGPVSEAIDVDLYHSDSAIVRTHLQAKKQIEFETGDQSFPEGIDITFFDEKGKITTTMRADRGFYTHKDNLYKGEGDVRVNNLEKEQKLSSEELFWDPNAKKIYTEKFVTIQERETLFNGTGMEADESFNEYRLFKVTNSPIVFPGEN